MSLNVHAMTWWFHSEGETLDSLVRRTLLFDLLASLPEGVRRKGRVKRKEGARPRGIWISGYFYDCIIDQVHELGRAWRELGLNFAVDVDQEHDWIT